MERDKEGERETRREIRRGGERYGWRDKERKNAFAFWQVSNKTSMPTE